MSELPVRPQGVAPRRVGELVARVPSAVLGGDPDAVVTGITHDSRQVRPGDLYLARAGEHTHGIAHVEAAVAAGAVAVLTDPASRGRARAAGARAVLVVEDPRAVSGPVAAWVYDDPADALTLLGITGTNGKTTTAYLVDAGFRAAGRRTALLGTIETRIGDAVLPSARTTPEATDLQALLAVIREREVDTVTMEVSSHALALGRVDGVRYDVAGFTNLSQDHLDFHTDMADYFASKALLFTAEHSRRGVVCVDDEWGQRLAERADVPVTTVGATTAAQWRRTGEVTGPGGGTVRLTGPGEEQQQLSCRLPGQMNLANAALAFLLLRNAGVDPAAAAAGIAALPAVPGRMERVAPDAPFTAIVDYAHTPEAVETLLDACRELAGPEARVVVVLGCGGDRDRAKRPLMGAAAAAGADLAVLTSDNPRSEDPAAVLEQMASGLPAGAGAVLEVDRRTAIRTAVAAARPGDVVVVAGRGHEPTQQVGSQAVPFDDRQVLADAVSQRLAAAS